jgi:membrane-bound lytic murein transglycosylase D
MMLSNQRRYGDSPISLENRDRNSSAQRAAAGFYGIAYHRHSVSHGLTLVRMVASLMSMNRSRLLLPGCVLLTLPLTGCPSQPSGAAAALPPQAVAPALPPKPAPQAAAPAPPPPPPNAEQQRVHALITQVDAAYARGEADYRKGMLAEAKTEFDRAVDLMLSSGIDIKSNAQLQDEFDHIVDQVNALEMEALKQGNGFVPKEEITPGEAASDVTFAVDPNLVAKATAQLATTKSDLPLMVNEYVAGFINFFAYTQKGHNTLLHSFQRSGRYRAMIQRVMAEEGVPQDLIYLAVAESGFQPRAVNRKSRAGGMWQFMPYGEYGLSRNEYVDERFDPEKSTRAYARYMKYLYNQLGDWYLAMAAYDHGAGNIQREVARTGYADFWELYKRHELPGETQNYVPEILAAIIIANNPHQYGFDEITLDPPVLTDTVTINYAIDLRLVSDLVGAPIDEIEALNPSLLRMVTPPDVAFDLRLPAGSATLFEQRAALIPEARRTAWRYHAVVAGDTLESVAQEYRVPVEQLATANQLGASASVTGVEGLVIPVAPAVEASTRTRFYVTRRGDTLVTIADRFGIALSDLRRWNGIPSGTHIEPGRRLHVAEPAAVTRTTSTRHRRAASDEPTESSSRAKSGAASGRSTSTASKSTTSKSTTSRSTASKSAALGHKPASSSIHRSRSSSAKTASSGKGSAGHKASGLAKASPR